MSFIIEWQPTAENTFHEEIEFIFLKWSIKEVQNFEELVNENLTRLSLNPEIGTFIKEFKLYALVISKQTTLYYNFYSTSKIIELNVFWNTSKNPNDLIKLL